LDENTKARLNNAAKINKTGKVETKSLRTPFSPNKLEQLFLKISFSFSVTVRQAFKVGAREDIYAYLDSLGFLYADSKEKIKRNV